MKKQATELNKIFPIHISDKGHLYWTHKDLLHLIRRQMTQIRNGQMVQTDTSQKNIHKGSINTLEDAQHH